MVAQSNRWAMIGQFLGILRNKRPRASSGAVARTPIRACGRKLETIGGGNEDGHARAIAAPTRSPVRRARSRRSAFSSILAPRPSSPSSISASSRVGTRSPAKAGANQLPASWRRMAASGDAAAGRALEPGIVQQDRLVVGGQADVELDPAAAERVRPRERRERVLGSARGGAAMTDDRRQSGVGRHRAPGGMTTRAPRRALSGRDLGRLRARLRPPDAQILAGLLIDLAHAELDLAAVVE